MSENILIKEKNQLIIYISLPENMVNDDEDISILEDVIYDIPPIVTDISKLDIKTPIKSKDLNRFLYDKIFENKLFCSYYKNILVNARNEVINEYNIGGEVFVTGYGYLNVNILKNKIDDSKIGKTTRRINLEDIILKIKIELSNTLGGDLYLDEDDNLV